MERSPLSDNVCPLASLTRLLPLLFVEAVRIRCSKFSLQPLSCRTGCDKKADGAEDAVRYVERYNSQRPNYCTGCDSNLQALFCQELFVGCGEIYVPTGFGKDGKCLAT